MTISIDTNKNSFILSGDVNDIISNKRFINWFRANNAFVQNDVIIVPFSAEDNAQQLPTRDDQYAMILRLLNRIGVKDDDINYSNDASSQLEIMKHEEESFKQHSIKANNIRNGIFEGEELSTFSQNISELLEISLTPKQQVAAFHLAFSQNACNFSTPGTGKTAMVYAAYSYLKSLPASDSKHIDRLFVICPPSAFSAWEKEFIKWLGRTPTSKRLSGLNPQSRRSTYFSEFEIELLMISYQSASNPDDISSIKDYLTRHKTMVILDEAHRIKSINGKWSKAVLSLAKFAKSRVILTGTPAPYGYQDLYNLYKFIWPTKRIIPFSPGMLEQLNELRTRHQRESLRELIASISPYFIRIRKSHSNLPEPIEYKPVMVEMNSEHKEIYEFLEDRYIRSLNSDDGTSTLSDKLKQAKIIRLRQAAINPFLLTFALDEYMNEYGLSLSYDITDRELLERLDRFHPKQFVPPKFITVLNLVRDIIKNEGPDGKVIIWTVFIKNLQMLADFLKSNEINCEYIYGETPFDNEEDDDAMTREKIISDFHRNDCKFKVLIANTYAIGESVSMHEACRNAIYLEKDFNAGLYMQSKDRIHRMGLPSNAKVNYYHLVTSESVDETIHRVLLEREANMLEVIENEEIPLLNMSFDKNDFNNLNNIKNIIKDYHARRKKSL